MADAKGVPRGLAGFKGEPFQCFKRSFADTPRRRVDDALQRHRVVRVADQAQVAEQILDFGALVEAETADHGVADVVAAQRFFNQARLRVGSVQHGTVSGLSVQIAFRRSGLAEKDLNSVGDKERFVLAVGCLVVADQASALAIGPQGLAFAAEIVGHHSARGFENDLRRSIILLEPDNAGVGEVFFKLENVADVGAAPGINALVLIANCADVLVLASQQLHQFILGAICVLVFIHEEIAITALVALSHFGGNLQQPRGLEQQSSKSRALFLRSSAW